MIADESHTGYAAAAARARPESRVRHFSVVRPTRCVVSSQWRDDKKHGYGRFTRNVDGGDDAEEAEEEGGQPPPASWSVPVEVEGADDDADDRDGERKPPSPSSARVAAAAVTTTSTTTRARRASSLMAQSVSALVLLEVR